MPPKRKVIVFQDYPDFTPNISPYEMFKLGVMGGTYFRKIYSTIANKLNFDGDTMNNDLS
jgi:hypothetical protein